MLQAARWKTARAKFGRPSQLVLPAVLGELHEMDGIRVVLLRRLLGSGEGGKGRRRGGLDSNTCIHNYYIYMYTYVYMNIYIYIYMYIHVCVHVYIHTCKYRYVYTYVCVYVCMYVCMYVRMYVSRYSCICLKKYICIYTCNTDMHTCATPTRPLN